MKWFKVHVKDGNPAGERGFRRAENMKAMHAELCEQPFPFEFDEATAEEIATIDPVRRGRVESSLEQLADEIKSRGWKVRLER